MKVLSRVCKRLAAPGLNLAAAGLGTITHVQSADRVAALTFDDGPHPAWTPSFLDVLAHHDARATFFMVGQLAAARPDLVEQVALGGHEVANHTWDHVPLPLMKTARRRAQLQRCEDAIAPFGGRFFRPPHGSQDVGSFLDVRRLGLQSVTWNVVAGDWMGEDSKVIGDRVAGAMQPGAIVLFHDWLYIAREERFRDRRPTLEALQRILTRFADYEFVTVGDLLRRGRVRKTVWIKPAPVEDPR